MIPKSIKIHAKSIQNQLKWCQGVFRKRPWEQVGSRLPKKALRLPTVEMNLAGLWRHLGDFGRHFGPSWAPRGSQNRAFWHQVVPKSIKMTSRGGYQEHDLKFGVSLAAFVSFWFLLVLGGSWHFHKTLLCSFFSDPTIVQTAA